MSNHLKITDILKVEAILMDVQSREKKDVIGELVHLLKTTRQIESEDEALEAVWEREECMTTGIGRGLAIPHGKYLGVFPLALSLALIPEGLDFQSMDNQPVQIVALLISHPENTHLHLSTISLLTRTLRDPALKEALFACQNPPEIYTTLEKYGGDFPR